MIFEFVCDNCKKRYERNSNQPFRCECGNITRRIYSMPAVIVKGGTKDEQITDNLLNDFYRGQEELKEGKITQTEIEVAKEKMIDRAKKMGRDPGYVIGQPPKLTKEEMAKKAKEQKEMIERDLTKYGRK